MLKEIENALSAIPGISNCKGEIELSYYYFKFSATQEALAKLCKVILKDHRWFNCTVWVKYDNGLVYEVSKSKTNIELFLAAVSGIK